MLATLHVIISSEDENDYQMIKNILLDLKPNFSISFAREFAGLKGHSEFYATCDLKKEEIQPLLNQLNNDWDGEIDECMCYGFNTKMFHPLVYCLEFVLYND